MKKLMIVVGAVVLAAFGAEARSSKMNVWPQASRTDARSAAGCERVMPGLTVPVPNGYRLLPADAMNATADSGSGGQVVLARCVRKDAFDEDGSAVDVWNVVDGLMELKIPRQAKSVKVPLREFQGARVPFLQNVRREMRSVQKLKDRETRANNARLAASGMNGQIAVQGMELISAHLIGEDALGFCVVRSGYAEVGGERIPEVNVSSSVIFWCGGHVVTAFRQAVVSDPGEARAAHAESERILLDWVEAIKAASKGTRGGLRSLRTRVEEPEVEEPEVGEPEADEDEAGEDEEEEPVARPVARRQLTPEEEYYADHPLELPVRSLPGNFDHIFLPEARSYPRCRGGRGGACGFRDRSAAAMLKW